MRNSLVLVYSLLYNNCLGPQYVLQDDEQFGLSIHWSHQDEEQTSLGLQYVWFYSIRSPMQYDNQSGLSLQYQAVFV